MKKFAFLIHLRSSYRKDLKHFAPPLGWIPDSIYRFALRNRPLSPFIWSSVTLTPGVTEPEGYIIILPYTGKQLLEQQKLMQPQIEQALQLAASKGAEIMGLGGLTSPITLGGKLVANNPFLSVTNGNAYTAVITWEKIAELIQKSTKPKPMIALVGATGSVGTLVTKLLAKNNGTADFLLVARNENRLNRLATEMTGENPEVKVAVSRKMEDVNRADLVVLLTSASECLLQSDHLKPGAVVLDVTQPRNTHPDLLKQRPDVTIIDGGLVSIPHLKFEPRGIELPSGISFACLAETILLAKAGHTGDFSIGNPTLEQATLISNIANQRTDLGFRMAPNHCFGKSTTPKPIHEQASGSLRISIT